MKPEKRAKLLERAIRDYDFCRVRRVMEFLDWKWFHGHGLPRVPDVDEMELVVRNLASSVDGGCEYAATGGFMVRRTHKMDGYYEISFCL